MKTLKIILPKILIFFFSVMSVSSLANDSTQSEIKILKTHPDCKLCSKFSDIPAHFQVFETEDVKVLMHENQYYLGRLVIIAKTNKKETEFRHFPDMETLFKKSPATFNHMMQVLFATHEGRRAWLQEYNLPQPEPFNELTANNLAYGREQTPGLPPDPHAHIHSWMRYKQPVILAYSNDFKDIRLIADLAKVPSKYKTIKFVDTEFGEPIIFGNDHNVKLPEPILKWIANSIAKKTAIFLKQAGLKSLNNF
jgi:hypothetical protein